jgi:hypothetical protein
MVLRILNMMKQQNFAKFASIGAMTLLGFNLVAPQNAQAILYDFDLTVNGFTATGTLETSGTGDFVNGDFTFTDWLVNLDNGTGGSPEFTFYGPSSPLANSTVGNSGNLEVGDIVATTSSLSFSNMTNASFDWWNMRPNSGNNGWICLGYCNGTDSTYIFINGVLQEESNITNVSNFLVLDAASASVPFEFSPTLGLLAVGSLFGISRLRKSTKSFKLK